MGFASIGRGAPAPLLCRATPPAAGRLFPADAIFALARDRQPTVRQRCTFRTNPRAGVRPRSDPRPPRRTRLYMAYYRRHRRQRIIIRRTDDELDDEDQRAVAVAYLCIMYAHHQSRHLFGASAARALTRSSSARIRSISASRAEIAAECATDASRPSRTYAMESVRQCVVARKEVGESCESLSDMQVIRAFSAIPSKRASLLLSLAPIAVSSARACSSEAHL